MRLQRINTGLVVAICLVNGYIIGAPLLPQVVFWWQERDTSNIKQLEQQIRPVAARKPSVATTDGNRLIIPDMLLDELVYTGQSARTLSKGLWLRPQGSTPDKGSNTVIAGHRFTYTNPQGSLYHLDKLSVGDVIALNWNGRQYRYTVRHIQIVKATQTSIEAPTERPRLTLYTCTPLWLPKERLVVIAEGDSRE